jgi:hypothetical protein
MYASAFWIAVEIPAMEHTKGGMGRGNEHEQRRFRYTSQSCIVSDMLGEESKAAMIPQEVGGSE